MKQSRWASFLETWGNTAIGFVGSYLIQWGICWWYDLALRAHDNLYIILVFTAWSLVRGYAWRRLMEALHVRVPLSAAMLAVIAERARHQSAEGFDVAHDDAHEHGELALAGASYLFAGALTDDRARLIERRPSDHCGVRSLIEQLWPWAWGWWKPDRDGDLRRDLVRGVALGLAEIERYDRQRKKRRPKRFSGYVPAQDPQSAPPLATSGVLPSNAWPRSSPATAAGRLAHGKTRSEHGGSSV